MGPPWSRRNARAQLVALALSLAAGCGQRDDPARTPPRAVGDGPDERANVVVLMADDLGWSDVGCYGGEIPTPAIDGLAAEGLRFRDFYTNGICGPTRASLLYGVYCQQVGHKGWVWDAPLDTSRAAGLGELLGAAGYRTLLVGKWQGGEHPLDRGFERFFGLLPSGPISYYDEVRSNPFYLDRERYSLPADFFLTDALADHAVRFLEESADDARPFFLFVAFVAPHWPLHAREADVAPFRALYRELGWDRAQAERLARQREAGLVPASWPAAPRPESIPAWEGEPWPDWQAERMAVYAAQVAGLDRAVGRVLAALDGLGAADETLVVFLSDNGAAAKGGAEPDPRDLLEAEGPGWRLDGSRMRAGSGPEVMPGPRDTFAAYGPAWAWVSNAPFRSFKGQCYEGGLRSPLVARFPGVVAERGGISAELAHVFDLYATCLDLAGVAHPAGAQGSGPAELFAMPAELFAMEGQSLLPTLRGEPRAGHEQLAFASKSVALRMGDWKIVAESRNEPWQLYNLARDGLETEDLSAKEPDRVSAMAQAFQAWRGRVDEH